VAGNWVVREGQHLLEERSASNYRAVLKTLSAAL